MKQNNIPNFTEEISRRPPWSPRDRYPRVKLSKVGGRKFKAEALRSKQEPWSIHISKATGLHYGSRSQFTPPCSNCNTTDNTFEEAGILEISPIPHPPSPVHGPLRHLFHHLRYLQQETWRNTAHISVVTSHAVDTKSTDAVHSNRPYINTGVMRLPSYIPGRCPN